MGIYAKGQQFPVTITPDTPQNRYGGAYNEDTAAGNALGEVLTDVNSKAESSNTTAGEIIADLDALEGRVDVLENDPGPDLSGYVKTSRVSTLEGRVTTLEGQLAAAISRIEALENNPT